MASGDNPRLPLTSGTSPIVKYTEMRNPTETPSTTITMASMPSPPPFSSSTSSHEPKANSSFAANTYELRRVTIRQRHAMKKALMGNVGYRLVKRKELHIQRRLIGDIMCIFGIFGIILMIIENELTFNRVDHKDTTSSLLIKATITFTTILLVCLVFYYHRINLSLHCVDNSIDDWRIALTRTKILSILFEAFICMIHPIPGHFLIEWSSQYVKTIGTNFNHIYPYRAVPNSLTTPTSLNTTTVSTTTTTATTTMTLKDAKENPLAYVPIDIMLSIPMFFRLYLVCRLIMLRSHLVRDVSSQSLGYLNRVSFNFPFIIKSYMQRRPTILLTSFCITTFFIASWAMRACDYNVNTGHMSMLDATWLFIISFTTIGYGDIVPSTYCGRGIAATTGIIGVFSTALLVAVIAQKLELTRSEKYVHNFVANIELAKAHKDQAANVVKYGWKVWYLRRKGKANFIQYIQTQRKLLTSIHLIRSIKQRQRKLADNYVSLMEIFTVQRSTSAVTDETAQRVIFMERKIDKVEDKLIEINQGMINLEDKLNILLDRITKK
ncbi:unnamed protein product [Rotaria magnacalcarata]|uniref:Calmodulin-binding domain-containing protein n=3 Tax=Rotaria magnacalcarata TaxID=392030 RepID=A0A816A822_9BILA|nr:unnamed protein product [Rotaria magnacalcarata]CAF2048722.1 unnamed protein product [Rotaria magnacalcarata]CAF2175128.1 unnamed protein product [Rotaria magnacalcarata]